MDGGVLWLLLALLLAFSATFSASETALFSLTQAQRASAGRAARELLANPRDLLVSVLFGNLVVNVLFFAFVGRLLPRDGGAGDLVGALVALVAVLICGEIVPKTLGLRARVGVARVSSPAILLLMRLLGPMRRMLIGLLDFVTRALGNVARDERTLTPEELADVLERSAGNVGLENREADLLAEIVELEGIRVREIMTPRVDTIFLRSDGTNRDEALRRALADRFPWIPVIEDTPDQILGRVLVRDLLAKAEREPLELLMPVKFVPEMASALRLLRDFHEDRTAEAVVVDEWGGTAGVVTLEDIFEELVGDLRAEDEARAPSVVPLGEGRYRVAGGLSIRDWNEQFGYRVVPWDFETLGGFVAALLGRIPRAGDRVRYGALEMEVNEVRGRRVLAVDIGVARVTPENDGRRNGERA